MTMKKTIIAVMAATFAATIYLLPAYAEEREIKVPSHEPPKISVPKAPEPRMRLDAPKEGFGQITQSGRKYNYYPDKQAYYDPSRKQWYYMSGGKWTSHDAAPKDLDTRATWSVVIEMGTDRPYDRHEEVRRHYPGGRSGESYRAGFRDGYDEGYRDAWYDGYRAAYERAYRDGYKDGYRDGDRSDRRPGEDRGRKEGWDKKEDRDRR